MKIKTNLKAGKVVTLSVDLSKISQLLASAQKIVGVSTPAARKATK